MSKNRNLHAAKRAKNDEFYTQRQDIEAELKHYKDHFKGKTVYCNCDDPNVSEFTRYFQRNFERLGLKRLISTCYKNQRADLFSSHDSETAIMLDYRGDLNRNREADPKEIEVTNLKGNGDFRSPESIRLLKQSDIVVTNPPFSLFREYVAQLIEYDKKFVVIGNKNVVTYKEIFPLIKNNKIWVGHTPMSKDLLFDVPEEIAEEMKATKKEGSSYRIIDGVLKGRSQSIWFTNLDHKKRNQPLDLSFRYESMGGGGTTPITTTTMPLRWTRP